LNPKNRQYAAYGGRGIKVAPAWIDPITGFYHFLKDIEPLGPKPSKQYSLDRKNNDGDYVADNLRWATRSEQQRNRRKFGCLTVFSVAELTAEVQRRAGIDAIEFRAHYV
jgi:hypothetical protein